MNEKQLIEINDNILKFISEKNLDDYTNGNIVSSDKLQEQIGHINDKNRALRVGIIGRVKAGKSSLLNALLFNGRDVLPKAATPMTAALTIMKYSEEIRAEVDFYSENDIEEFRQEYQKYKSELEQKAKSIFDKIKGQNKKTQRDQPDEEIKRRAESQAKEELENNQTRTAAYQQYTEIQKNPVSNDVLKGMSKLKASSIDELMGQLNDYVGAGGAYMPYTKSVELFLPEPGLKDLEIVDTPGVNDPVQSREKRTNEFLSSCDVVLVISPAGQFLSQEDIDLMARVTTEDGVLHAYLVASQSDNQLFGSMRENKFDSPTQVLTKIADKLSGVAEKQFAKSLSKNSELQDILSLYSKHGVICTSSAAFAMLENFNNKDSWDDGYKKVWENLDGEYPDFFDNDEVAKAQLLALANIEKIKDIVQSVRAEKDTIQAEKRKGLSDTLSKKFKTFLTDVDTAMINRIEDIETTDIEEERKKLESFQSYREEAEEAVRDDYQHSIDDINHKWRRELIKKLKQETKSFNKNESNQISRESRSETYIHTEDRSFWNLGGILNRETEKTRHWVEQTIHAGQVYAAITDVRGNIEDELSDSVASLKNEWDIDLNKAIFSNLRSDDKNEVKLNRNKTNAIIRGVLHQFEPKEFEIANDIPSNINKHGKLSGNEAEQFAQNASDYMNNKLYPGVKKDIDNYINDTVETLGKTDLATKITEKLVKDITKLIDEIENKEISIKRCKIITTEAEKIKKSIENAR